MKLVINSNVRYQLAVDACLESLLKVFPLGCPRWRQVVIVSGGSKAIVPPRRYPGKWGDLGVTLVNLTQNSQDWTALSALYRFAKDPLIVANSYLYVHDTVLFDWNFTVAFDGLAFAVKEDELHQSSIPNSNIFAFGYKVIGMYGTAYNRDIAKSKGIGMEYHGDVAKHVPTNKVVWMKPRQNMEYEDIYHTGHPRVKIYYPDLAVKKYVLPMFHGDIGGDGKLTTNKGDRPTRNKKR